jgi:hypothetical protein
VEWRETQPTLDPSRLIFIDETWTKTNMVRLYGWAERGYRLVDAVPRFRLTLRMVSRSHADCEPWASETDQSRPAWRSA